jgi:hypothetical protein
MFWSATGFPERDLRPAQTHLFSTGVAYTVAVQPAPAKSQQSTAEDASTIDPSWAPPDSPSRTATPNRRAFPAPVLYGSIVLVLVLLVVAVSGLGGFKRRTDLFRTTPPGTVFTIGPYEFRFTEATAQHKKDFGGALYWEVVMIGEGRTTGTESSSPKYFGDSGMFVSKDDVTQQIVLPDSVRMGQDRSYDRSQFTPGLPLSAYAVVFKYADTYRPGPTIRFAVSELVYGTHYLASDEKEWHNGTYSRQFYLPVRVLPEEIS